MEQSEPLEVITRLHRALNAHDLEAFVGCFSPGYRSEQPAHPNRAFGGYEQVRKNWTQIFSEIADIHADLVATAVEGSTVWAEWDWKGTHSDGSPFAMRGVMILGIKGDRIASGRLYLEPVEQQSGNIDQAVKQMTKGKA